MKAQNIRQNDVDQSLGELRNNIDAIDAQFVSLLSERQQEVDQVAVLKKAHHLTVYHPAREEDLISRRRQQAKDIGFDPDFIEEIYRAVIRILLRSPTIESRRDDRGGNYGCTIFSIRSIVPE